MKQRESKAPSTGPSAQLSQQGAGRSRPKVNLYVPDVSQPVVLALGDEWLSPQTVAAGIESCVTTVLRAFRKGELPGHKLSARLVRFRRADVLDWLNRAKVGGTKREAA
jgi:excisionase family DNA binding protein